MAEEKKEIHRTLPPIKEIGDNARIKNMDEYKAEYDRSVNESTRESFWKEKGDSLIDWYSKYTDVTSGGFEHGDIAWYVNGKLNVCYNCVDRHVKNNGDKVAILWEGDSPDDVRRITYKELLGEVSRFANALKRQGVKKGDNVCIYMPMVPETAFAMLACARIGAPHNVVFAGFSAESLRSRIIAGDCKVLLTADQGLRGTKVINLKKISDDALSQAPLVKTVFVLRRTGNEVPMTEGRDIWWHEAVARERPYCPCEVMDSEDPLFMLYTSGSTGRPKGLQHSSAGYLVYTMLTHKYVFDLKDDDVYGCVADVGWITGHSYIVYGPLSNCSTTFMFESTPLYPDAGRYWDMINRHKISIFYTAPTAIRALMKFGNDYVTKYDRSSLRILGTVGEPINPEAWQWYYEVVGDSKCSIVDTYWQTETGGVVVTPFPGCTPMKPGAATTPFFGIDLELVDEKGAIVEGNDVNGILTIAQPWPSIARTCYGDHQRYLNVYMAPHKGKYLTGDGAYRDADGHYWITGRVDDVINVSGHRLGSADIESALVEHDSVVEAAVVGVPHDVKGSSLFAYVTCKVGVEMTPELFQELRATVGKFVGSFAKPGDIVLTPSVPKTRSGKIMRRLLRKIACGETDLTKLGDITTLADSTVVEKLIVLVQDYLKTKNGS